MKSVHTHRGLRLLLGVLVALLCFSQHVLAGSKGDKEDVKAVPVSIPQHLVNSNLHRFIDLSSPIVRERTTIIIQNKGESPASEYWLSVPAALADASLSLLTAKTAPKKEAPQDLLVEKSQFDAANDVQYFKVKLASPLAKDEKLTLQINVAYTHVLKPYPKAIAQSDVQFVEFSDSVYFHTPYFTEKQRITVHLPTSNVKNYTNANLPVVKKGTDIVYGPYTAVDAFERSPLYVHFEFPRIVAVARNYEKEIELSHWGNNMFVKEHYELHNEGAKLKGHYARVDLYFKAIPNALRALDITLPPNIKNVFYRDAIGNVSTSNFHQNSQRSLLQIKPRYPVFGGWKYTWHHTFDVPLDQFVKKDAHRDRYILQVPILGSIPNVTVDHGHFKIILPEGASFVEILSPYTFDKQTFVKHYTVFDSTGRQAVVLEKRNMVDEFGAPIQIVYDFPAWRIFQKPLVVSAAFGAIFLIGIIAARLDLSISKDPAVVARALKQHRQRVGDIQTQQIQIGFKLSLAMTEFKRSLDAAKFEASSDEIYRQIETNQAQMKQIAETARIVSPQYAAQLERLVALERHKILKTKAMYRELVTVLGGGTDSKAEQLKRDLSEKEKQVKSELDAIELEIKEILTTVV